MKTYEERLAYVRKYYRENIHIYQNRRQAQRDFLDAFKAKPCMDCGVQYPPHVMDFDHVRGEKLQGISQMICMPKARIEAEVAKCEVVCANCHRERTHQRHYVKPEPAAP